MNCCQCQGIELEFNRQTALKDLKRYQKKGPDKTTRILLDALKAERANWERRVSLLKSESIDPDMLDERARVLLNYADPRELTLRLKRP